MSYVFVSDYDGTLYIEEDVKEEVIQSIHDFKGEGNRFGICTGRNINSIKEEIERFKIPVDFLIGNNGGIILNGNGEEIFTSTIASEVANDLASLFTEYDVVFYGVSDGYNIARIRFDEEQDNHGDELDFSKIIIKNGPCGFYMRMAKEQDAYRLANRINDQFSDYDIVAFANDDYVDIGKKGFDKASGVQLVMKYYNWTEPVVTIGDSYNDIPMLKAYQSYGMTHGVEAIRKHADNLVDSVNQAIDHLKRSK